MPTACSAAQGLSPDPPLQPTNEVLPAAPLFRCRSRKAHCSQLRGGTKDTEMLQRRRPPPTRTHCGGPPPQRPFDTMQGKGSKPRPHRTKAARGSPRTAGFGVLRGRSSPTAARSGTGDSGHGSVVPAQRGRARSPRGRTELLPPPRRPRPPRDPEPRSSALTSPPPSRSCPGPPCPQRPAPRPPLPESIRVCGRRGGPRCRGAGRALPPGSLPQRGLRRASAAESGAGPGGAGRGQMGSAHRQRGHEAAGRGGVAGCAAPRGRTLA